MHTQIVPGLNEMLFIQSHRNKYDLHVNRNCAYTRIFRVLGHVVDKKLPQGPRASVPSCFLLILYTRMSYYGDNLSAGAPVVIWAQRAQVITEIYRICPLINSRPIRDKCFARTSGSTQRGRYYFRPVPQMRHFEDLFVVCEFRAQRDMYRRT